MPNMTFSSYPSNHPAQILYPYAVSTQTSRGRQLPEPRSLSRTDFQRDRERIVHSTAFRRLEYKTQVFINHEGDLFRTRLTHSIEVAQIARAIARNLGLNEDLTEAIALAHDLGHAPFGHAGQEALNICMKLYGGFEHNLQSLRVVDHLEQRYAAFNGLNLTFETREGILKHCNLTNARLLGELGRRFIDNTQPSLEAQIANLADEIAYNNHDIDDGLRSGLLSTEQMQACALYRYHHNVVMTTYPEVTDQNNRRAIKETLRRMINALVIDVTQTSAKRIELYMAKKPLRHVDDVRSAPPLIIFSEPMAERITSLKSFLNKHLYRHYHVHRMAAKAQKLVTDLFNALICDINLLPPEYRVAEKDGNPSEKQARRIADYIANMTDRYAIREHKCLFSIEEAHLCKK